MTEKKSVFIRIHPAKQYGMWLDGYHYCIEIVNSKGGSKKVVSVRTYVTEDGALQAAKRFLNDLDMW